MAHWLTTTLQKSVVQITGVNSQYQLDEMGTELIFSNFAFIDEDPFQIILRCRAGLKVNDKLLT